MKLENLNNFNNLNKKNKIKYLGDEKIVEKLIYKLIYNEEDKKDLSQDIYEILLKNEKIEKMTFQEIRNFILNVAKTQIHSYTSPFYRQYRELKENSDTEFDINNETNEIIKFNSYE